MNPGGDAAEQVVRLSLEGVEVAARISGAGAKNIALLLYATLKQEQKTKGKARLTNLLKSGKELKVYTITQKDLAKFAQEAKRYGVLYCVLKDRKNTDPNAAVDIIARAEDASKIQRITERFKLATVDRADVSLSIQKDREKLFPKDKSVKEALKGGHLEIKHDYIKINRKLVSKDSKVVAAIIAGVTEIDTGWISKIWVDEDYRLQGLGTLLLKHYEKKAKEKGATKIIAEEVYDWNVGFFIKAGYQVAGVLEDLPKDHTFYILEKDL